MGVPGCRHDRGGEVRRSGLQEARVSYTLIGRIQSRLGAQLFGHALFPRVRLEYAEAGGELGRRGALTAVAVAAIVVSGLGAAYAVEPPTIHLHGTIQGPLVIRHAQTLVGGVVKGGILIRANNVTLRDVTVVGGEDGIDILDSHHVLLDNVRVVG